MGAQERERLSRQAERLREKVVPEKLGSGALETAFRCLAGTKEISVELSDRVRDHDEQLEALWQREEERKGREGAESKSWAGEERRRGWQPRTGGERLADKQIAQLEQMSRAWLLLKAVGKAVVAVGGSAFLIALVNWIVDILKRGAL